MLIFGFHPVREALRNRAAGIERVFVGSNTQRARAVEIETLCAKRGVRLETVPGGRLDELTSSGLHNGFAAELRDREAVGDGGDPELVVLLEDVQDPRNLGAILRVCEGAGVGKVLIRDRGSAPLSATAVKTSAGASEHLEIERVANAAVEIERLQKEGFWVYGADGSGEPLWDVDFKGRVCLCLGGEEKGLRSRTRALCDRLVALPMRGRVASLNVSTAAAALLYEAVRQRMTTKS